MGRGPVALFGAIVAVGLGPALWLGAQFGSVSVTPGPPPAVEANQDRKAPGRAGAAPEDQVVEPKPESQYVPLSATPSGRLSASATSKAPKPDGDPATGAVIEPTTQPPPSNEPSTQPTESTTEPTGEPDPGVPTDPVPPAPEEQGDPAANPET